MYTNQPDTDRIRATIDRAIIRMRTRIQQTPKGTQDPGTEEILALLWHKITVLQAIKDAYSGNFTELDALARGLILGPATKATTAPTGKDKTK